MSVLTWALHLQSTGFGADQSGASTATAASLVDEARAMLTFSGQNQAAEYTSEEHLTRCLVLHITAHDNYCYCPFNAFCW